MVQEERQRAARRLPKVPELGATAAEAKVMCSQQGGTSEAKPEGFRCAIAGAPLFICTIDRDTRFNRCDGYYEGADLGAFRKAFEKDFGVPASETVSETGFRLWEWRLNGTTAILTMYERGVRTSMVRWEPRTTSENESGERSQKQ